MKLLNLALASCAAAFIIPFSAQAKNEARKAYIYGFASSFNDSIVYITDIQEVDSAWFSSKNHFLLNSEGYSAQLHDYIIGTGDENRTCMVEYGFDAKKVKKSWNKLIARYKNTQKKKNNQKQTDELPPFQIKSLTKEQFAFQAMAPNETVVEEYPEPEKKAKKKKAEKGNGAGKPDGPGRPGGGPGGAPGGGAGGPGGAPGRF